MRRDETTMIRAQELRIGNSLLRISGNKIITVTGHDIIWCAKNPTDFNGTFKPLPLTENVMKKFRKVYNDNGDNCVEFSCHPPGERQVNNNFWSRDLHDGFCRLHMSPSYKSNKAHDELPADVRDNEAPEFWFTWLVEVGTGSGKFMSLVGIHDQSRLRFVHEFQNLFFWIERRELILR